MAGDRYRVEALAVPESLNLLHDLLERVGAECPDVGRDDLAMFETAIIEIAGNVVEHGCPPGAVVYTFGLEVAADRLVGELSDSGEAFARPDVSAAGAEEPPDVFAEDGRGLFLANAVLDELTYERAGGRNVWHMVRRRR